MSNVLRQRRGDKNKQSHNQLSAVDEFEQSVTDLPSMDGEHESSDNDGINGTNKNNKNMNIVEVTNIPTAEKTKEAKKKSNRTTTNIGQLWQSSSEESLLFNSNQKNSNNSNSNSNNDDINDDINDRTTMSMTGDQVAKDESRLKKVVVRVASALGMISVFFGCVWSGHVYVCMIVALSEFLLFRELVKVRYNVYFNTIEDTIPLFRTTQWMWFMVAIFYTYSDFVAEVIQNNSHLHYLGPYSQYVSTLAFLLYSGTFVLTIATMQVGLIKFQLNQLCWTIVVLCLTVGQMKYIMHNIFNGLFWFTFPFLLVVVNDIMAYFSGMTCGRKFIHRPFISFSPNKTWEGFIGGGIFTMVAAWYLSRALAQYAWMTCPNTNEFQLMPAVDLHCDNHHVFQEAQSVFPAQIFELFPSHLVKMIPGIIEYCSVRDDTILANAAAAAAAAAATGAGATAPAATAAAAAAAGNVVLERCISGEPTHVFHHFELILKNVYPIQIHALWLGFFASVVAPFGGFLASAIKRAYGIKDFDSFIPGHGGITDRLDCQFLMALCTWVHYNTFVKLATVSVPKLIYMYNMLSEVEQKAFVEEIAKGANRQIRKRLEDYSF